MKTRNKTATLAGGTFSVTGLIPGKETFLLRGINWNKEAKAYQCPASPGNAKALTMLGYTVPEIEPEGLPTVPPPLKSVRMPFAAKLRPYQREGVVMIERWGGRVLLADEMGLGKTIQVIAWALCHPEARPVVVVCPAAAKYNWKEEIEKWAPGETVAVLQGRKGEALPADVKWGVVNYDILTNWRSVLTRVKLVAIDEAHYIRNHYKKGGKKGTSKFTQRTDAVLKLCRDVPHVIAITGSPVINRPMDLFVVLKMLRKDLFPSKFEFGMRYCEPTVEKWSGKLVYNGCCNPEELNKLLVNSVMIRRLKADVLKDLPPKQRTVVKVEMDPAVLYSEKELLNGSPFETISALRKQCGLAKLPAVMAWVDNFLESGEKLILFCHHRAVGEALAERYGEACVSYRGGLSDAGRWDMVKRFQNDPTCKLFIGSITACGFAINLTAASNVAFAEYPWTPAEINQCEDRAHRIGQKSAVNVWYLMAPKTVDEDAMEVLVGKAGMAGAVLDGGVNNMEAVSLLWKNLLKRAKTPL